MEALRSMNKAEAEALVVERDCEEIAKHPVCRIHESSLEKLRGDINACRINYEAAKCGDFFKEHPNYFYHKNNCNLHEACHARSHLALAEGCKAVGIEFSKAITADCKKGWFQGICISGHLIYSSFESLIPYLKGPLFGGRSVLGDAYRATKSASYYARHLACFDTEMQNKIACYVAVGAGSIVVTKGASLLKFEALVGEIEGLDAAAAVTGRTSALPRAAADAANVTKKVAGRITARAAAAISRSDPLVADNDVYAVSNKGFLNGKKMNLISTPVDSWGRGANAKSLFGLSMRVANNAEAREFAEALAREIEARTNEHLTVTETKFGFRIGDRYEVRVHPPTEARRLLPSQGGLEAEVEILERNDELKVAADLKNVLETKFNLKLDPNYLGKNPGFDLTSPEGAADYGRAVFGKFNANLPSDARVGFRLISGPDYRDILPYLRTGERSELRHIPPEQVDQYVSAMDKSIAAFKTPRPLKVFRAVSGEKFEEIWKTFAANPKAKVPPITDKAYSFTSLDEKFVQSWQRNKLRGKGVVLEIKAPSGTHAGFIEREQGRDYAEVVLGRNQPLRVVSAYTDSNGVHRLVVEVVN